MNLHVKKPFKICCRVSNVDLFQDIWSSFEQVKTMIYKNNRISPLQMHYMLSENDWIFSQVTTGRLHSLPSTLPLWR